MEQVMLTQAQQDAYAIMVIGGVVLGAALGSLVITAERYAAKVRASARALRSVEAQLAVALRHIADQTPARPTVPDTVPGGLIRTALPADLTEALAVPHDGG